jgi:hypothetical protein
MFVPDYLQAYAYRKFLFGGTVRKRPSFLPETLGLLTEENEMASTDTSKGGSKSGSGKSASSEKSGGSSSGKQGGSHEQHVKAGEQSHKNSK